MPGIFFGIFTVINVRGDVCFENDFLGNRFDWLLCDVPARAAGAIPF